MLKEQTANTKVSRSMAVLILILMEYAQRGEIDYDTTQCKEVLILILMEYAQRDLETGANTGERKTS